MAKRILLTSGILLFCLSFASGKSDNALEETIEFLNTKNTYYYEKKTMLVEFGKDSSEFQIKNDVIPKPSISSLISINNACSGYAVPLKETTSFPYNKLKWIYNDKVVKETSRNEIFEARQTGYYKVSGVLGTFETTSDSMWIEIGNIPSSIDVNSNSSSSNPKISLCGNMTARFYLTNFYSTEINLLNNYGFKFQWKHNNQNIEGATDFSYSTSQSGTYHLQLIQGDCIASSIKYEITKKDTLDAKIVHKYQYSDSNKTVSLCKDERESYIFYIWQPQEETYNWNIDLYKNGQLIESQSPNKDNYTLGDFYVKESGKYSAKLYSPDNKTCIALTDTVIFNIIDHPIKMPTDTIEVCNDSTYLDSRFRAETYKWTYNDKVISNSYFAQTVKEGLYTLEAQQTKTCTIIQPILFKRRLKLLIVPLQYTFTDSKITLCQNQSVNLYLTDEHLDTRSFNFNSTVEWYKGNQKLPNNNFSLNVKEPGNYFAKVKYKDCEVTTDISTVYFTEIKKDISPNKDSLNICINGGDQTLVVSKGSHYTYEWFKDNISLGNTNSSLKVTQPGTYKALIQAGNCVAFSQKVKINQTNKPPTATISGDTTLIAGNTANLKLSFTASPPFSYTLNNNETRVSEKNNIIHPVKVNEGNIFRLTSVSNSCGEGTVSGEAKIQILILANEPLIGHKITLAPVPAESYCEMTFDLPTSQEVSYQLLDMKGQQLSEKNLGNITYKKQYLNLNQLSAGEYLIRIQVGKDIVTRKLIKY